MFTAIVHKSLAGAEGYFVEHLSQNDYYAAGEIRPGQWIGIGSERLGLKAGDEVTRDQFYALCENQHPQSGERLTQRQGREDKRRVFYDFTCSAPKAISVLAVTLNDQRLVEAHEESARVAFRELETFAGARVRKSRHQGDRTTANLIAALFVHDSSRALDPLLHTHFTVFNATFDQREQCWKALQAGAMYEAIRYATAVYRNELARRVREIGYRTIPAVHGFGIEGVSDEVQRRLSKRSQEKERVVREMEQKLGRKLSNNEVAYAVHQSRTKKLQGIPTAEVRQNQLEQLLPDERQSLRTLVSSAPGGIATAGIPCEQTALSHATAHVFERKSVVPEHELLATALSHRPGELDLPRLKQGLVKSSDLIRTDRGLSTRKIVETELSLIHAVEAGSKAVGPLHPTYIPSDSLSEDQQRAIFHVLRTSDRIAGIRGLAGTGKTTALRELVKACKEARIEPLLCAPTAAATDVLRKERFNAVTLQSLLLSKPDLSDRHLVILDEAGAVGIDDMKRLFEVAKESRVLLSGDTGQHASVARGDALRMLEQHSSFQSGQLTCIRRQRHADYRKAVKLAAQKRTAEAFGQLERMGAVTELSDDKLYTASARAYLKAIESGKTALLVAPTWAEIERVTETVRTALKASDVLSNQETSVSVFDLLSWTQAQKKNERQYRSGMALCFHQSKGGFTRGETVEVLTAENGLSVRQKNGTVSKINPAELANAFDAGETRTLKIAPGDKLLLQSNWQKQFVNGELVEVKAIQAGSLLLTDGRVIPERYRTFTHGYAVTSHAAQGKTVDEVLVVASSRSLAAVSQEQFYVSISRGRDRCRVFTDDADRLRSHVTRSSKRPAAIEVISPAHQHKFIRQLLRLGKRAVERVQHEVKQTLSSFKGFNKRQTHDQNYAHHSIH
jgi:conjugative relaxase-like TrwC/TraI family protein